jgi:hypothetical protein
VKLKTVEVRSKLGVCKACDRCGVCRVCNVLGAEERYGLTGTLVTLPNVKVTLEGRVVGGALCSPHNGS